MSSTNFKLTFNMSDGTTLETDKSIDGLLFSGDDLSSSTVSLTTDSRQINPSKSILSYLLQKSFNKSSDVKSGTLVKDMITAIKNTFSEFNTTFDSATITDKQWIESCSDITVSVSGSSGNVDVFDKYLGKYTFTSYGLPTDYTTLQIPQLDSSGNIVNNQITLRNGDSITIFGLSYNSSIVYNILNENIQSNKNIIVTGDLSKSGSIQNLSIPEVGIKFSFTYVNNGGFNVTVYPLATTALSNLDLRRYSIWNGGSVETFTIDNGSVPVAGTNIDTIAYSNSQDVSTVLVSKDNNVWRVTYWASNGSSRFRAMAEKIFI